MSSNTAAGGSSVGGPMTGKTVLITGATSGIGKATALGLAAMGANLVITGRDVGRTESAAGEIRATGGGQVETFVGDLSAQSEVRRLAAEVLQRFSRLDVCVNNVGGYWNTRHVTADGLERSFALNHLTPFLLTNLLLDRLTHSAPAWVVTVASTRTAWGGSTSTTSRASGPTRAPGPTTTIQRIFVPFIRPFMKSPAQGAVTSIQVASAPDLDDVTGCYFSDRKPKNSSKELQPRRRSAPVAGQRPPHRPDDGHRLSPVSAVLTTDSPHRGPAVDGLQRTACRPVIPSHRSDLGSSPRCSSPR